MVRSVLASALALTACAANEAPPAQTPVAPEEFAGASVIVTAPEKPEAQALKSKLEQQLVRTGHRVATTESEAHELTAVLSVNLTESKGLLTVYVDGKPKQSFTAHASLHVRGARSSWRSKRSNTTRKTALPRNNFGSSRQRLLDRPCIDI